MAKVNTKLDLLRASQRQTVILGTCYSVNPVNVLQLAQQLTQLDVNVVLIPTQKATPFLLANEAEVEDEHAPEAQLKEWQQLKPHSPLKIWFEDKDEWESWSKRSDPVLHVELRKVSAVLLVAPLSANTMGKFANGLADNLLTNVFRAWDIKTESCIVAPAMDPFTYQHPITAI